MDDGSGFVSMPMLYIDLRGLHQHRGTPTLLPVPMLSVDCPGEIGRPGVREALEGDATAQNAEHVQQQYLWCTTYVLRLHNIPLNTQLSNLNNASVSSAIVCGLKVDESESGWPHMIFQEAIWRHFSCIHIDCIPQ